MRTGPNWCGTVQQDESLEQRLRYARLRVRAQWIQSAESRRGPPITARVRRSAVPAARAVLLFILVLGPMKSGAVTPRPPGPRPPRPLKVSRASSTQGVLEKSVAISVVVSARV
jgi:hypothetical protein